MNLHRSLAGLAAACALAAALSARADGALPMIGWLEKTAVEDTGLSIVAKVDTGADFSSLDARDIRGFKREGEPWVSFTIVDDKGESIELERRVFRYTKIRRAGGDEQSRPTVILGLCVGAIYREVQVNLVNRSTLEYRMLIGRDFMQGRYVVDPARAYVTSPTCPQARSK